MLKATPLLLPLCDAMAVLMPITSPSQVDQRAAAGAGVDRGVGLQEVLDADRAAEADLAALAGADDAVRHRLVQAERAAERQHPLADADPVAVAQRRAGRSSLGSCRTATSDSGSVQTRVGLEDPAVGQADGDLVAGAPPMTWLFVST